MKKYIKASSNQVDWAQVAEDNYDKIADVMEKVHLQNLPYPVDIYLYPNGEVSEFENVGRNSWLDDDHVVVATIDHSFWEIPEWEFDANGNYSPENIDDLRRSIYDDIDQFIETAEHDKEFRDSYEW